MSAYVMFYLRDDQTSHWIELDSWSRSCEMYKTLSNFVDFEKWTEVDFDMLHLIQSDINDKIQTAQTWIKKYRAELDFLVQTKCSLREIMDEKVSIDSAIEEWEDILRELEAAQHELEVYESIMINSQYNDNHVHLCAAHECDPNDTAVEDD